jgi:hypothetical protein
MFAAVAVAVALAVAALVWFQQHPKHVFRIPSRLSLIRSHEPSPLLRDKPTTVQKRRLLMISNTPKIYV